MYYGITESESFSDPTILNQFKLHKVVIEKRGEGKGYWHIFILEISETNIKQAVDIISKALKPDWSAMFFNDRNVFAVFKDVVFPLQYKDYWKVEDYAEVKKHSLSVDVGNLDMNEAFKHYRKLLKE